LKESNPIDVTEYAISCDTQDKPPAFAWLVPYTTKQQTRILTAINARYHKKSHKFGMHMSKSVQEAYAIDKENGNNDW
jgi:hypothetical protein